MHYMWPVLISLLRIHIQPKSFGTEYRCCRKKYIVLFTTMANIREIKNFKVIGCLASINDCARGIQFISLFHGFVFMFCVIWVGDDALWNFMLCIGRWMWMVILLPHCTSSWSRAKVAYLETVLSGIFQNSWLIKTGMSLTVMPPLLPHWALR